jgi:hypothetical protein
MSKAELRKYATWFHSIMPGRTEELARTVNQSIGIETWGADLSLPSP